MATGHLMHSPLAARLAVGRQEQSLARKPRPPGTSEDRGIFEADRVMEDGMRNGTHSGYTGRWRLVRGEDGPDRSVDGQEDEGPDRSIEGYESQPISQVLCTSPGGRGGRVDGRSQAARHSPRTDGEAERTDAVGRIVTGPIDGYGNGDRCGHGDGYESLGPCTDRTDGTPAAPCAAPRPSYEVDVRQTRAPPHPPQGGADNICRILCSCHVTEPEFRISFFITKFFPIRSSATAAF